jgi:hypothetical protein
MTTHPAPAADDLSADGIVAFFDAQLFDGTDGDQVIEASAAFVSATVGRLRADGHGIARDADGTHRDPAPPPAAKTTSVATGGVVWVVGLTGSMTDHFLDRLAASVAIVERWTASRLAAPASPVDALIDIESSDTARRMALKQLRVAPGTPVRVVISSGPDEGIQALVRTVTAVERLIARTMRDDRTVLLLAANDQEPLAVPGIPIGIRAAYGRVEPAERALFAYSTARDAYRFSRPSPHDVGPYQPIAGVWLNGARLAGLSALCRLSGEDIEIVPDVAALDTLAEQHGEHILQMLEAYATTESLRKAAALAFMHHNTVTYWVQKAEEELGYSLTEPYRRAQLFISLCLYRLWKNQIPD